MSLKDDPSYRPPNFGWDLPPGVSPGMIPGNRREDEEVDVTITMTVSEIEDFGGRIPAAMFQEEEVTDLLSRLVDSASDMIDEHGRYQKGKE